MHNTNFTRHRLHNTSLSFAFQFLNNQTNGNFLETQTKDICSFNFYSFLQYKQHNNFYPFLSLSQQPNKKKTHLKQSLPKFSKSVFELLMRAFKTYPSKVFSLTKF